MIWYVFILIPNICATANFSSLANIDQEKSEALSIYFNNANSRKTSQTLRNLLVEKNKKNTESKDNLDSVTLEMKLFITKKKSGSVVDLDGLDLFKEKFERYRKLFWNLKKKKQYK